MGDIILAPPQKRRPMGRVLGRVFGRVLEVLRPP